MMVMANQAKAQLGCDIGYYYNYDPDVHSPFVEGPIGQSPNIDGYCSGVQNFGAVCHITVCAESNFVIVPGELISGGSGPGSWNYTSSPNQQTNIVGYSVTPSTNLNGGYVLPYNNNTYVTNVGVGGNWVGAGLNLNNLPAGITLSINPVYASGSSDCFTLILTVLPTIPASISPITSAFCNSGTQFFTYTPNNPAIPPIYLGFNSGNGTTGGGFVDANFGQINASWQATYNTPGTYIGTISASYNAYPSSNQAQCKTTHTFEVIVSQPIGEASIIASNNNICAGEAVSLSAYASGATNFVWQPGSLPGNPIIVNPTTNTTYYVTASNAGCPPKTAAVTINAQQCCLAGSPRNPVYNLGVVNIVAANTQGVPQFGNLLPNGTYNGNIAAPANGIITGNYNINGNLNILTPVTFSRTNVSFAENVTVFQNADVTITRSWWHGCSKMWNSIRSSFVLNINGSIIEDANTAVVPAVSTHPGMNIENNVFNINNSSFVFLGTTFNAPGGSPAFSCKGNIFTSKVLSSTDYSNAFSATNIFVNSLVPNLNTYVNAFVKGSPLQGVPSGVRSGAGIRLLGMGNTTNVRIGYAVLNSTQNALNTNYFNYLDYGVYNISSRVAVENARFENLTGYTGSLPASGVFHSGGFTKVGSQTTSGISSNNFSVNFLNSNQAIYATTSGTIEADCNTMTNLTRAVSVQNQSGTQSRASIKTNTFVSCQIDFYGYANGSNLLCNYEENLAYGPYPSGKRHHVFIDEVNKSNSAVYKIKNNNMNGKEIGVSLQNDNGSTIFNNSIMIDMSPAAGITYSGIELIKVDNSYITDNIVNCNNGTVLLNTSVRGIASATCSGNTYACNTIKNTGVCFKFEGSCPSNIWKNILNINRNLGCKYGIWLDNAGFTGPLIYSSNGPSLNEFGDFDYANGGADTHVSNGTGSTIGYIGAANSSNIYYPLVNTVAFGFSSYTPFVVSGSNLYNCGFSNKIAVSELINEQPTESNTTIYPNPAQDNIFIKTDLENYSVLIMDISGRIVLDQKLNGTGKLNIEHLNNGVYIYKINDNANSLIKSGKLAINH